MVAQKPKKKEINKPSAGVTLKPFFWDKMRDNELKDSVIWTRIAKEDIELPEKFRKQLEDEFRKETRKEDIPSPQKKLETPARPKAITCLESKKAQQIGIMLQKFRMPIEQVVEKLLRMEDLTEFDSGVDNLVASCPGPEELSAVKNQLESESDVGKYAKPEQYVIALLKFPKIDQRLKNWQYMKGFYGELGRFRACF